MSSIVAALKETSKGKLSYRSQLDNETPREIKKAYLDKLNTPVMSPEAIKLIDQMSRLSLDTSGVSTKSPETSSQLNTSQSSTGLKNNSSLYIEQTDLGESISFSAKVSPRSTQQNTVLRDKFCSHSLNESDLKSPGFSADQPAIEQSEDEANMSVMEEFEQELNEELESIDDRFLKEMNENIKSKRELFEREAMRLREIARVNRVRIEKLREDELEKQFQLRLQAEQQAAQDIEQKINELKEEFVLDSEKAKAKLKRGEERKKEIKMIEERERRQALEKLLSICQLVLESAVQSESRLTDLLTSCKYPQLLEKSVIDNVKVLISFIKNMQTVLKSEQQSGSPDQAKVLKCRDQLNGVTQALDKLKASVEAANLAGEKEAQKQAEEAAKKLNAEKISKEKQAIAQPAAQPQPQQPAQQSATASASSSVDDSRLSISKSMLELYSSLQDLLSNTNTTCASLTNTQDAGVKKYRFDLQKAVTATVNSISTNSGQDLIEKIGQIRKLLSGHPVQVGTKTVSIKDHQDSSKAYMYCLNLLAAKIVKQGEKESSNIQSVFPLSALTVGIWTDFEELGHYLLAHFYSTCPVLVPMYINKSKDISEADYLKSLGYKVNKGVVESQDLFLNRVRGTVRLYAAIIQTPQLPNARSSPHPHGLEHGWAWLARMLNVEPHPVVTAAALGEFLEITGHAMMKRYGKQFQKLLFALWTDYIPKIERITTDTDKGSLTKLKLFIESCIKTGKLPQPKGCLTDQFWNTRSQGITIA